MNKSLSPLESPVLREYNTYEEAQRLVDQLSDAGFPVQHVRIVGHDFHSVEQVTGRLTKGRAALLGAGSGAWFGLLIGLLLSLFAVGPGVLVALLGSVLIGGVWELRSGSRRTGPPAVAATSPASPPWWPSATPSRSTPNLPG